MIAQIIEGLLQIPKLVAEISELKGQLKTGVDPAYKKDLEDLRDAIERAKTQDEILEASKRLNDLISRS